MRPISLGVLVLALSACPSSVDPTFEPRPTEDTDIPVDADGDGFDSESDCDDENPDVNPGQAEVCNEVDDNCDGFVDEGFDYDGDGYFSARDCEYGDDCDDRDGAVNPGAVEIPYNGKDEDCDETLSDLTDVDGDGFDSDKVRDGTDCDDDDASVNPDAPEVPYDSIDQNCDGADLLDVDGDGHDSDGYGGDDCDDADPSINPSRMDWANDDADQDCDGTDGRDADYRLSRADSVLDGLEGEQEGVGEEIILCDFDGDSVDDVLVSAWGRSNFQGQISIFLHQYADKWDAEMALDADPDIKIVGDGSNAFFGRRLACGDLNGDGRDDLIATRAEVNARPYDTDMTVFIYYGDDDWTWSMDEGDFDVAWTADLWPTTGSTPRLLDPALAVGDLDGDGKDEVVLGFEENVWPEVDKDVVYIIPGRRYTGDERLDKLTKTTLTMGDDVNETRRTGLSLAIVGDADGDGNNDLAIAQPFYQTNPVDGTSDPVLEGRVLLYSGLESDGTMEDAAHAGFLGAPDERIGLGGVMAADVDGSGTPDLIIASPVASQKRDGGGVLHIWADPTGLSGTTNDPADSADGLLYTNDAGGQLGWTSSALMDIDGDGTEDLYVRQRNPIEGGGSGDDLYVVGGQHLTDGEVDIDDAYMLTFASANDQADSGEGFAAGDVTGDNAPDFFVGGPDFPTQPVAWRPPIATGRAYFYASENYPWGYVMGLPTE